MSRREIAEEIDRSLDFLTTSLQNVPERHRSLWELFERTWNQLSQAEQAVLAKLSIFRGSFSRAAAVEVAGAMLPLLTALVDRSLVSRSATGQYELHGLLQQYANEKLAATPDDHERTWYQYCRHYAALVRGYEGEHKHSLASTNRNLFKTLSDWPNIQAAWHQALASLLIDHIGQFAYF